MPYRVLGWAVQNYSTHNFSVEAALPPSERKSVSWSEMGESHCPCGPPDGGCQACPVETLVSLQGFWSSLWQREHWPWTALNTKQCVGLDLAYRVSTQSSWIWWTLYSLGWVLQQIHFSLFFFLSMNEWTRLLGGIFAEISINSLLNLCCVEQICTGLVDAIRNRMWPVVSE